jgi:hypothetical protein
MFCALRDGTVEKAVFVGSSNAGRLAGSTSMLGVDVHQITSSGWKITQETVCKLLPDLESLLATLPADTPVVIFAVDNSVFMCAAEDGSMAPLKKLPEIGGGFHAVGELVVAPDRSLVYMMANLKQIAAACGDRPVFIVSPIFASPCLPAIPRPDT